MDGISDSSGRVIAAYTSKLNFKVVNEGEALLAIELASSVGTKPLILEEDSLINYGY